MANNRRTPLLQGILSFTNDDHSNQSLERYSPLPPTDELSPRQTTPTKLHGEKKPDYITELSLSDADNDVRQSPRYIDSSKRRLPHIYHEVLRTEIEGDQDFSKSGEVSVKTYKVQSPARVVCHSPSSFHDIDEESVKQHNTLKTHRMESGKPKSLLFTNVTMETPTENRPKNKSMEIQRSKENTGESGGAKKKKKRFIPVESRFMLASKKPNETLKSRSLELSAITPHSKIQHSQTQQLHQQQQKKSRATSTPFVMTSMYEGQAQNDGSILDQTHFKMANDPIIKQPLTKKTTKARKETIIAVRKQKDSSKRKEQARDTSREHKGTIENDQLLVDLYHTRRLQQTYLDMNARQTFNKQEEKAKNEMYAIWSINRRLEKEIEALTLFISTRKMEIAVDQLLNAQLKGFKPLPGKLSKIILKSGCFADALSNVSNYLDINDVTIGNEESLLRSLDESKQLLADINALTRRSQPQIEELSTTNEVLRRTLQNEMQLQSRCSELLGACASLMNKELSLQAQVIQT